MGERSRARLTGLLGRRLLKMDLPRSAFRGHPSDRSGFLIVRSRLSLRLPVIGHRAELSESPFVEFLESEFASRYLDLAGVRVSLRSKLYEIVLITCWFVPGREDFRVSILSMVSSMPSLLL